MHFRFKVATLALVAFGVMTSSASAWHATAKMACPPTATYSYEFPKGENTAYQQIIRDGIAITPTQVATGYGSNLTPTTLTTPQPADGKPHTYIAKTWWTVDAGSATSQSVTCAPVQPPPPVVTPTPPVPTPTATPPATPVAPPVVTPPPTPRTITPVTPPGPPVDVPVDCNGKPMTPGTTPSACKPPRVCPNTKTGRYRLTVTPRHAVHGTVRFRLKGPHVRKVKWYVDMKRRGIYGSARESVSQNGRTLTTVLWDKDVWGPALWGKHWVTVRALVGPKGCGHVVHKRLAYFNQDPPL